MGTKTTSRKGTKAAKASTNGKAAKPAKQEAEKRLSALDAAAKVLAKSKEPMGCQELIDAMAKQKLWASPNGKTPAATLYAAILREITRKGTEARFKKTDRGRFAAR